MDLTKRSCPVLQCMCMRLRACVPACASIHPHAWHVFLSMADSTATRASKQGEGGHCGDAGVSSGTSRRPGTPR